MTTTMQLIFLAFATWYATTIIVESEIAAPIRSFTERKAITWKRRYFTDTRPRYATSHNGWALCRAREVFWCKVAYLVTCHLCTGWWVGLAVALASTYRLPSIEEPYNLVLTALAISGVARLILELTGALKRYEGI